MILDSIRAKAGLKFEVKHAAAALGVSERTVRHLVSHGLMTSTRRGVKIHEFEPTEVQRVKDLRDQGRQGR